MVVGATPAGIMAAQAALREGATVGVIENTQHVGGMLASGLSVTDSIYYETMGGLAAKFFRDVGAYYGLASGESQYTWEPHAAESIFNSYLDSPKIGVILGRTVASVWKRGTQIQSITLDNGTVVGGTQWIDATYEGDLMAFSGATFSVGRESSQQYGEGLAGWGQNETTVPVSPYLADGSLIPLVIADPMESPGQADGKIMAYSFRSCLTNNPKNMLPFPMPPGYTPDRYIGVSRYINYADLTWYKGLFSLEGLPNSKYCLLNSGPFSTDYPNAGWAYPNANWKLRAGIFQDHSTYVAGFLYFLANDPSVPASVRANVSSYGLALDEFTDNNHWPWQMYVREGRRLHGQYVMTQSDITTSVIKADAVGVGQWYIDSHFCCRYASSSAGQPVVMYDGSLFTDGIPLYQLPLRAILPPASLVSNLAVPVCVSASHISFCSLRVEPTYMVLGEAAGTVAGLALKAGLDLSEVDVTTLQNRLLQFGAVIAIP